jgi:hypothetical protein
VESSRLPEDTSNKESVIMAQSLDKAVRNPSFTYVLLAIYDNNPIVAALNCVDGTVPFGIRKTGIVSEIG